MEKKRNLLIVESPAKAKTIGQYLGDSFVIKASYGHVRDLPKTKLGIDVKNNFDVDYLPIAKAKNVISDLKKELEKSDALYLAPDPDREGEAIAWHLTELLKTKKPTFRVSFTEITKSAVQEAVAKPRKLSMDLVDAQQARRILDRLVGYKLSPLLWKKVYRGLSAGRVQSVAVRLIVEREREIKAFKTREFWTLEADCKSESGNFKAAALHKDGSKLEVSTQKEIDALTKILKGKDLSVNDISESESLTRPVAPLITSTLQQMAARLYGFSAKRTMRIAQELYEGIEVGSSESVGLITYMRTDSFNIAQSARNQATNLIGKQFGAAYLPEKPNIFTKKVKGAQEAHEAIRPSDFTLTPEQAAKHLSRDHARLYEMIYKTALGSMMAPAQVKTTVATLTAGKDLNFQARGRKLIFDGYLKVYPEVTERYVELPKLKKDEKVKVQKLLSEQHFTEPPARYSEATLVKELEKRGIGRPSTYAPIMSTIVDRGYVTKQTGRFIPESVAEVVTDLLVENFPSIVDYNFTADMEESLDDIADGKKEFEKVLAEFYGPFEKLLAEKDKTIEKKALVEEKTDQKCPKCGKVVVIKLGRYGKFYSCSGYPDCDYRAPYLSDNVSEQEKEQIQEEVKEKCPDCGGELALKQSRFGNFIGCSNYPKCKYTKSISIAAEVKCPNCGGEILRKNSRRGKVFWGCGNYPKCKTAFWYEPVDQKCPKCNNLLVKKKGGLSCSQCDYTQE
ncbi:type I DNA topoisomerase [Candidatus Berkelbacteria bacterium]|nr:type I DNA topoisomerase [Candidatus Berkelbacteria bacterium]